MYLDNFDLPVEFDKFEGCNALEKIAAYYRPYDTLDETSIGVYKVIMDENENVKDVIYVYTNPMLGKMINKDYMWMRGHSYKDTIPGASSKWFDIAYQAGYQNKIYKDKIYAPGLQQFLHFTAKQAFAPGYAIFTYTAVSDVKIEEVNVKQKYKTNDLVITISRLLRLPGATESVIERAMDEVGCMLLLDQFYIIESKQASLRCMYEWKTEGRESVCCQFNEMQMKDFIDGVKACEKESSCIDITDTEIADIQKDYPVFSGFFLSREVKELIIAPFYYRGKIKGYLIGENPKKDDILKKELFEQIAFFFGMEIQTGGLMQKLEYLNRYDLLTNTQSRNAMEEALKRLRKRTEPIAVAYVDINGLKWINDEIGHDMGDKKIQQVGYLLVEVFDRDNVYRAGGDEFVILRENISQEDFLQKIAQLQEKAKQHSLSIAVGYRYTANPAEIDQEMKAADQMMYKDKQNFYKSAGKR